MKTPSGFTVLFFSAGLAMLTLWHCSVATIPLEVLAPAEIMIEKTVEHVGIINYSRPSDHRLLPQLAEAFLSRESIFADQTGAEFCMKGLAEKLNASPRFTPVVIYGETLARRGSRSLPEEISWATINRICRKYRLDAVIALEYFDSDIRLDRHKKSRSTKKKDEEEEEEKPKVRYRLDLHIRVSSGWRIYYPPGRRILDAQIYRDDKSWTATGDSVREARSNLPDKRDAINEAGFLSGSRYGERISPTWITLSRSYYTRGSPEFEEAGRHVRAGDWEGAVSIWKRLAGSGDPEVQGQAVYNLAFAAEIKGDLRQAARLAESAYTRFGNKKALRYLRELQQRILEEERLEKQLD
jgi:hypothetical protein